MTGTFLPRRPTYTVLIRHRMTQATSMTPSADGISTRSGERSSSAGGESRARTGPGAQEARPVGEGEQREHADSEQRRVVRVASVPERDRVRPWMTPALAANVCDTLWSMGDLVALVDKHDEAKPRQKPGRKPKAGPR